MSNSQEKQPNNQQEYQAESNVELITKNEFKEKTNKIIDDILVSNIKDSDFDLENPEDKKWYDGIINTKDMVRRDIYEIRFFADENGARVPKSFETPAGFLKERLFRFQEDIEKNKEQPGYLTDTSEKYHIENIKELKSLLFFIESTKTNKNEKEKIPQTETIETKEILEGEKLFENQFENNAHPEAKNIKVDTVLFLDNLDRHNVKTYLNDYKEEIEEILYRRDIEYDSNKKPEFSEKNKAVLEPLWKFRKELDEWDTFIESRVCDYRKRVFEFLHFVFGIEEQRPNEGEKLNRTEQRTIRIEETKNQLLDNLIKKVIRPGFKINDRSYEYCINKFLAEEKKRSDELGKLKNKISQEKFDEKYNEYLKWDRDHTFTKSIRPADVVIYKYNPESGQ